MLDLRDSASLLEQLTDEQINQLITDHWREIRGLLREKKRRIVFNTDQEPLDTGHRDGWAA
jgi:hypothetical protein